MIYSSPLYVRLRNVTRKLGLNKLAALLFFRGEYEDRYGARLLEEIRPSDTVWDVGANIGLYTSQFSERVGDGGLVVAFEPVPACFAALERVRGRASIYPVNAALGAADGELTIALEEDALATTHKVVDCVRTGSRLGVTDVPVRSGESFAAEHPELFPNLIKVDVEGFEGEVYTGLKSLLDDVRLRCVGMEVHFGILRERGEADTPRALEKGLVEHGFRVEWTDPSHLVAIR